MNQQDFKDQAWREVVEDHAEHGIDLSDDHRPAWEDTYAFQQRVLSLSWDHFVKTVARALEPHINRLAVFVVALNVLVFGYHLIRWAVS